MGHIGLKFKIWRGRGRGRKGRGNSAFDYFDRTEKSSRKANRVGCRQKSIHGEPGGIRDWW
jgi:hypothetical protein